MLDVETAVKNNIYWCGIVSELHGLTQVTGEHVWGLLSKAPEYYPDMITSNRHATSEEVHHFIGNRKLFSIKDSFANLDMEPFGFKVLFEAKWIYHPPVDNVDIPTGWAVISTGEDFARWTSASRLQTVLKSNLIERKDIKIFMHEIDDRMSGFIANLNDGVVGISNVFSNSPKMIWSHIAPIVSAYFPVIPMAGYEHGHDLTAALLSGWTTIGPLRVWIKAND